MRILLATNYFSTGNTGNFIIKCLAELGHHILPWDFRIAPHNPPKGDYDLAIAYCVNDLTYGFRKDRPSVLVYLDDPAWWKGINHKALLENVAKPYTHTYTLNKLEGYKQIVLGCDKDVHKKVELREEDKNAYGSDATFIGTVRDKGRYNFVNEFISKLDRKYKMTLWGENWNKESQPIFFLGFNNVCNSSKVVLNEHFCNSPSTKVPEIMGCGGGLLICDNKPGVRGVSKKIPVYNSAKEAVELTEYYIENEEERKKLVDELQKIAYEKYTYKVQFKKLLKEVMK